MILTTALAAVLAVLPGPSHAALSEEAGAADLAEKAAALKLDYRRMMGDAADLDEYKHEKKIGKLYRKGLKGLLKRSPEVWEGDETLAAVRPELEAVLAELEEGEEPSVQQISKRLFAINKRLKDSEERRESQLEAKASRAAQRKMEPAPGRVFQSDWLLGEDLTSHENVLGAIRDVQNAARKQADNARGFALALKRSSEYKKAFKGFKQGLEAVRKDLPQGWEADALLKDLQQAIAAAVEKAEKEGEDWKGKFEVLDRHADTFKEHLSKGEVHPEARAKLYWATQPAAPDPGVGEDFFTKLEAVPWPNPRPVPKEDYFEKRLIGDGVDLAGLQSGLAESQERSRQSYRSQSEALRRQDQSELADARMSGASYASMRSLAAQQGQERREAMDRSFAASSYMSAAALNYAMTAANEERERAKKRGDEYRLRLWRANLDYFEGAMEDAKSGTLTGAPLIVNVQAAKEFAAEGVPQFFDYYSAKEENRLSAIRATARKLDYDLTKRGDWIPAPASYALARAAAWKRFDPKDEDMARFAKIVHRIMRNDPRAAEVLSNSPKKRK